MRTTKVLACIAILAYSVSATATPVTERALYSFGSVETDGIAPSGRLAADGAGNLYGTTQSGGSMGYGTAFELSQSDQSWTETIIYSFCSAGPPICSDGRGPFYGPIFDANGNLYGSTQSGGIGTHCPDSGCGVIYELSPPSTPGGTWTESLVWSFGTFAGDGCAPSDLTWDAIGNLYGTTGSCGLHGGGTVFELSPPFQEGGNWTETILYNFCPGGYPCNDGSVPIDGVVLDSQGNLYGSTAKGGAYNGVVYQLTPPQSSKEWTESVLVTFTSKTGGHPQAGLSIDGVGNLYGTVSMGGPHGAGAAFRLARQPGGGWKGQEFAFGGLDGYLPISAPLLYGGAVYGTTNAGGHWDAGTVFQIRGKNEVVVYNFCPQRNPCLDGANPSGPVIENSGNFYGVTSGGGDNNVGVVYELSH